MSDGKVQWDEECNKTFEELKQYLEALPALFKPISRKLLWLYLSATLEIMGAVLVKEHKDVQQHVYFLSHLLKGVELRYTMLEKLAYKLVLIACHLHPYFLTHPITTLTNSSSRRVLINLEASGRLI